MSTATTFFSKDLRRAVIFGRNDLVKDAPISRVDLLVCRNTLMYLNADTQRNVLSRLHFALSPHGVLFLGHAEMMLSHCDRFAPVGPQEPHLPQGAPARTTRTDRFDTPAAMLDRTAARSRCLGPLRDLAFRASPVAQIVVTGEDTVAMINQQAEATLRAVGARHRPAAS